MTKHNTPNQKLLQLILRAQRAAVQDARSEQGSAMLMTSIVSILMFSMMGAYLTMTNLSKSSTDAYIDSNNTFYAAESGLNKRAHELREKFVKEFKTPSKGSGTKPEHISECFTSSTTTSTDNDFECRSYEFKYHNNIAQTKSKDGDIVLSETDEKSSNVISYNAFTFIEEKFIPKKDSLGNPTTEVEPSVIPSGETYAGLNALEYKYVINATAAQPTAVNADQIDKFGDTKTVLQMDFTSRAIPLFQFGAFYEGNLELNPSPEMTFNGWLHTNKSIYLTAGDKLTLTLDSNITAVETINVGNPLLPTGYLAGGKVRIKKTPGSTDLTSLPSDPTLDLTDKKITITDLTPYNGRLKNKLGNTLKVPEVSFLTKNDPNKPGGIGEYYGKADLRLEMFPDKAVPFKLQVIASGTGAAAAAPNCDAEATANKPLGFKGSISSDRFDRDTVKCTELNEGQLRSLMQPVLVRPRNDVEFDRFCKSTRLPVQISTTDLAVKERILDALYLSLVSQSGPVKYSTMKGVSIPTSIWVQFEPLLDKINGITSTTPTSTNVITADDITKLKSASVVEIAALASTSTKANAIGKTGSCFLPAPIQALFNPTDFGTADELEKDNPTNFNNRREGRYIRMLQTNVESLTLWNRDGLFLPDLITPTNFSKEWTQRASSSSENLLFVKNDKDAGGNSIPADTSPSTNYSKLRLAAKDRTEGGLVIHATINKTTYSYINKKSPYGFAFNGGADLPAPLTIATDQAVYSQGDWNTVDKKPASFLADSITVLSNRCIALNDRGASARETASLAGQINCGAITQTPINPAVDTTINAAFLGRTDTSTDTYYSGGLNNYMGILEDWNGTAKLNYTGSLVSLGKPEEVSGKYQPYSGKSSYARPPVRNWSYDTSFNDYNQLPPLSPTVTELKQEAFKRAFNK